MIRWEEQRALPRGVGAVLGSLRFADATARSLTADEWDEALAFCDRFQLTLFLASDMPETVRARIESARARNRERVSRVLAAFRQAADALSAIEFVVLKGFAHWGLFVAAPENRMQYDLDLYCRDAAGEAREALGRIGYEPIEDQLTLVRKTGWQWSGDFYDPEIPIAVDLHTELWKEATLGFGVPGLEEFWSRRVWQSVDGIRFQTLAPADALAFMSLHLLRHLLRTDARPVQVYELAYFLDTHAGDDRFWDYWRQWHGPDLRQIEAICFRLAEEWFGCRLHHVARGEVERLPSAVRKWFERCAASPITAFFRPNKDDLALHLSLLDGFRAKARVVRRRLLPVRPPGPLDSVYVPRMTWRLWLRKQARYVSYVFSRGVFHARALAPAVSMMLKMRR